MVVKIIYPMRHQEQQDLWLADTCGPPGCFRPHASLFPKLHVWVNSQKLQVSLKKSIQFDQVSSGTLDLFCECSKKSLKDPDLLVSRILCTFYAAWFAFVPLFYQPCVQRSGLSITDHGQLHSFHRTWMDSVQFSFAPGIGVGIYREPHWIEFWDFGSGNWGTDLPKCIPWRDTFSTWGITVRLVWTTCCHDGWWFLPSCPSDLGCLQTVCEFLCPRGLWEDAEKCISLFKLQPSTEKDCAIACAMYKKDPVLRTGAGGCCHQGNSNRWQQTIAFVC